MESKLEHRNRSSAWTPEEVGEINNAMNSQIEEVAHGFIKHGGTALSAEQFEQLRQTVRDAVIETIKQKFAS